MDNKYMLRCRIKGGSAWSNMVCCSEEQILAKKFETNFDYEIFELVPRKVSEKIVREIV